MTNDRFDANFEVFHNLYRESCPTKNWLGCDSEDDEFLCTLPAAHEGRHEAWTCGCNADGTCLFSSASLVNYWEV